MRKLVEYRTEVKMNDNDEYGSLLHSLSKGFTSNPHSVSGRDAFLECFHFLESRLPRGTVWQQDGSSRTCLHYLSEMAEETLPLVKADGSISSTDSSAMPILQKFLDRHGLPHLLERVPDSSIGVVFLTDTRGRLAFHIMALQGDVQAMSCLINHIRAVEAGDERNAAADQYVVSALLTLCNNHGWAALHFAASEGRAVACNYLLEASELDALTSVRESVVDLANEKHHNQVTEYVSVYIEGRITREEAILERENTVFVRAVKKTVALELAEDQLMEAIISERERLFKGREP